MGWPGREGRARSETTVAAPRAWSPRLLGAPLTGVLALLLTPVAAAPASATGPVGPVGAAASASVARAGTPLRVELDDIVPGALPRRGSVTVSGSLANADDQTWSAINLYVFLGDDPVDDPAELAAAALTSEDVPVGDRITERGTEARVESLEPGESAPFTLEVPASLLLERVARRTGTAEPGVYWFGVHALGASDEGRDQLTDARARTFLPLLPRRVERPVATSLVLPLREPVAHDADGSISDVAAWTDRLSLGGRLRDLIDFGAASGDAPVSWLVDPAVLGAVARLTRGNPARLADVGTAVEPATPGTSEEPADASPEAATDDPTGGSAGDDPSGSTSPGGATTPRDPAAEASEIPSASAEASEAPGTTPPPGSLSPAEAEAAERALVWLDRFSTVVAGDELLALPYGDVDVAGALDHGVRTYRAARRRQGPVLRALAGRSGSSLVPTVAPPSGYLDPGTPGDLDDLGDGSLLLGSDLMLDGPAPSVALVEGRPMVLASSGAATGGPGPTSPLSTLALRQRVLSEAALRLVTDRGEGPDALVVVLPARWRAVSGSTFFEGLSTPAIRLSPLGDGGSPSAVRVGEDELVYPERRRSSELGEALFDAVDDLRGVGRTLENLLTRNDTVAAEVDAEAFSSASYADRRDRGAARESLRSSRAWVRERLAAVQVEAPSGVTLSGDTGSFAATLVNTLDEPVVVGLRARTDDGIAVPTPEPVELAAGARSTVELQARDVSPGVHNVRLRLVDAQGRLLPGFDVVPIRSAQVSNVIWLLLGGGAALLVLAAGTRTVRRLRSREAEA